MWRTFRQGIKVKATTVAREQLHCFSVNYLFAHPRTVASGKTRSTGSRCCLRSRSASEITRYTACRSVLTFSASAAGIIRSCLPGGRPRLTSIQPVTRIVPLDRAQVDHIRRVDMIPDGNEVLQMLDIAVH